MLRMLGCRGTIPVSGKHVTKYGGNTSCLYMPVNDEECVVFDCGTGITSLNGIEFEEIKKYHIFFTHFHWDHIIGLPIFKKIYSNNTEIQLYMEKKENFSTPHDFLKELFKPPFFPVSYGNLRNDLDLQFINVGSEYQFDDVRISSMIGNHPDGCLVYKIARENYSVVFATDFEHGEEATSNLINFSKNVDYLIFDTTYFPEDYQGKIDGIPKKGWGHSTYKQGVNIAKKAGVNTLVLFHHNPDYNDNMLDEMLLMARSEFANTICAYDGMVLY